MKLLINMHLCINTQKTLESPLDSKEIKPVNPKGNEPWIFIGRTDAEAPMLWPPEAKSWFIGKDPAAGKDWRQEEKRSAEDEIVGWYHQLNGHELEQTPKDSEGQGSLACWCLRGHKELDVTERLNNKHTNTISGCQIQKSLLKSQLQDRAFQTLSANRPFGFLISNLSWRMQIPLLVCDVQQMARKVPQLFLSLPAFTCLLTRHTQSAWDPTLKGVICWALFSFGHIRPSYIGCESWTVTKAEHQRIDAFELWGWRGPLRVPLTARRSNQSILKEINPE